MDSKFSVGERVRIKMENGEDPKRVPKYIRGKLGLIQEARGELVSPRDHHRRPPVYSVVFSLDKIVSGYESSDLLFVDVFEDWMIRE